MTPTRKEKLSTTPPDFPYQHRVVEDTKTIEILSKSLGQMSRYGVPGFVEKYYPGYTYNFVSE
jgi:hypothetical protein